MSRNELVARPFKFRWLDLMTMHGRDLTALQLRILTRFFSVADQDGGSVLLKHENLADELGVHHNTVNRNLRELVAREWVVCTAKGGKDARWSKYQLRIPARLLFPATAKDG